jgi:MinD-like ATPase involved in chromosome partitioning or flagellar assembly
VAVWGPAGAPGRTTVSVGLAAELAHRSHPTVLVDADAYGGAVAQHLGVLDEVSGVLAAARAANAGELDPTGLAGMARQVGDGPRVLTGLPRADRWTEVREPAFTQVLEQARTLARFVVVDTGFSLEVDGADPLGGSGPQRNAMTLTALERADEVLMVGSADPVGLARLARGLAELLEQVPGCTVRVVVNRSRASLGWREGEIHAMIEGFVSPRAVHFLPEDRAAADRALVAGRSLVECGESALRRAIAQVADALLGEEISVTRRPRRLRPRR